MISALNPTWGSRVSVAAIDVRWHGAEAPHHLVPPRATVLYYYVRKRHQTAFLLCNIPYRFSRARLDKYDYVAFLFL